MPGNKRRAKGSASGGPPAKRAKSKWSSTKFGQLLEKAGLVLGGDQQQNILSVDPALFQRQLTNEFKKSSADDSVISSFMKSFREYVESPTRFKKSLLPTEVAPAADIRDRFGGLDSLIRLLLGIDAIQPLVADVLLEWLPDYMDDGSDAIVHGIGVEDRLAMPKLILGQMRWLDNLVNGKDLCDKLLEVVEIAPAEMQREIIVALPEILDDPQHNDAAQKLKTLLATTTSLTAPIVDALSNLNIEKTVAAEVLDAAMNSLQSAEISDLPTVLKFIHEYMTSKHAQEVASEIRLKINLDFDPVPVISSTPRLTQPKSTKSSDYFVVLDTIRTSISFQRGVADGWIKAISAVSKPEDHRVIDVFVLFVLYSISSHRKTVEKLFVSKVRSDGFNEELMNTVFGSHPEALREFFPTLLLLCDSLLCSSSPTVAIFAMSLYCHLFEAFRDICCQQDVVDSLVVHINNGTRSEVDHALDVLMRLLNKHCKIIVRFESFIKTALDYLGHLSIQQIRKLYQILATMAFSDLDHASSLQSEIHTIIRKQLTHFEPRYRHIGVIGSVMTIQQIASRSDVSDSMSQNSSHISTSRRQEMARTLLEEAMTTCSHSQECSVLFCDEMSCVVPRLATFILEHLGDQVTGKFQDTYLVEMTDGIPQGAGVSLEYLHGLDTTDEGSIGLNLFPMVVEARTGGGGGGGGGNAGRGGAEGAASRKEEGLVGMASMFHLLRKCELQMNGNLDGIDALLGCPVLLCSNDTFKDDKFECLNEVKRLDICHSLFYCINWFRELVSAFAGEVDIDMKGKVIIRLKNITDLQDRLGKCMAVTPSFSPPSLTVSENKSHTTKGKSTRADVTLASMTAATVNVDKESTCMDKTVPGSGLVEKLLPTFRPLDLSVFKAFQFGCLSRTMLDSDCQTREQEEVKLQVPQLIFLLQDLCSKLSVMLGTFGPKAKSGGGGGSFNFSQTDLVEAMVEMMPALCSQLESNSAYFQELLAENDGVVDMGAGGVDYPQYCLVCHLLLKVFSSFFGWTNLSDPKYSKELRSCLSVVMERITTQSLPSSLQALAYGACKYFQKFAAFLPTLTCAHALAQVMVAISKTSKAVDARPSISRVCGEMLQRPWQANESNQLRSNAVTYLLKHHIEWASDCLRVVEVLAGDASTELLGEEPATESSKYPTLSTATFPWFYRAMMTALVNQLKTISLAGKNNSEQEDDLQDKFIAIQLSAKVFSMLVDLVQSFNKRTVLATVLKVGKQYVEIFVRHAMPILDVMLKPKKDGVISVLKTLQRSTRYLQHCCSHSKVAKDTNLINHVPQLKKSLEVLLFRVKELMASHNCQGAFWVGTLKNRDLQGQEILSQITQPEEEEEEDEDEVNDSGGESNSTVTVGDL